MYILRPRKLVSFICTGLGHLSVSFLAALMTFPCRRRSRLAAFWGRSVLHRIVSSSAPTDSRALGRGRTWVGQGDCWRILVAQRFPDRRYDDERGGARRGDDHGPEVGGLLAGGPAAVPQRRRPESGGSEGGWHVFCPGLVSGVNPTMELVTYPISRTEPKGNVWVFLGLWRCSQRCCWPIEVGASLWFRGAA